MMMLLAVLCSCAAPGTEVDVHLGERLMDDRNFYREVDEHEAFGLSAVHDGWEVAYFGSRTDYSDSMVAGAVNVDELSLGYRWTHDVGPVRFYLGPGVMYAQGEGSAAGSSAYNPSFDFTESDSSGGFYWHAGVAVELLQGLLVGFDVRQVLGTRIRLDGFPESDLDYTQGTLFLGWSW